MNLTASAALAPGIGLRTPHLQEIERRRPALGFLEVHPENYFVRPAAVRWLEELAEQYPISLHAVGLSLGSAGDLDPYTLTGWRNWQNDYSRYLYPITYPGVPSPACT